MPFGQPQKEFDIYFLEHDFLGFQLDMAMLLRQARYSSLVSKHLIGLRCPWLRQNAAVSSLTSKSGPENGDLGAGETNTDIGVVDAAAETRVDDSGETLGMVEDILAGGFEVGGAARKYAETKAKLLADYKNKRSSKAKMYIEIKSFDSLSRFNLGNLRNAHVVGLPTTRSLYTVLRSPHIDKKSREQFETRVHKTLVVIDTQAHKMEDKLKWLLRHDIPGVQLKVTCHYQTRLAMPPPSNAS